MFKVISACGMSSCQKLMGNEGWVPARIDMNCRLKVCIARSALLDRFVYGGTNSYCMSCVMKCCRRPLGASLSMTWNWI